MQSIQSAIYVYLTIFGYDGLWFRSVWTEDSQAHVMPCYVRRFYDPTMVGFVLVTKTRFILLKQITKQKSIAIYQNLIRKYFESSLILYSLLLCLYVLPKMLK